MKALLYPVILMILFVFGGKVKQLDATSQEWAGGQYESGYGTNYRISLLAKKSSEHLNIDQLWVGEDFFEVKAVKNLANRSNVQFDKRDTVYLAAGINFKPDGEGRMVKVKTKEKAPPFSFDGQALVGYSFKGKRKYLEIDNLRVLDKIIYP